MRETKGRPDAHTHTHTHTEEKVVGRQSKEIFEDIGLEIGTTRPQTNECQQPPDTERDKEGVLRASRRNVALLTS